MRGVLRNKDSGASLKEMIRAYLLLIILTLAVSSVLLISCAKKPSGKEVFQKEFCPACHYFRGLGKSGGIDISAVGEHRSRKWIKEHIVNPKSHDPNIGMPSFAHLKKAELNALVDMLTSPVAQKP